MDVRGTIASGTGKLVRWGLHDVLHRHASQLPGRVALALDPQLIEHLRSKARNGSMVVCGTNGKTTTTGMIATSLEAAGNRVLCNRDGANMAAGVAAALLPGRDADWAVLEADELSTIHILPQLKPRYLLLLNLFRDQLDRAGELEHLQDTLVAALAASPNTTLVVCGDDPLSWGVALRAHQAGTQVLAFGIAEDLGTEPDRVPEGRFCQRCGTELTYTRHAYAQLGAFACPFCGFSSPELDFFATDVHVAADELSFLAHGPKAHGPKAHGLKAHGPTAHDAKSDKTTPIHMAHGGTYMVYNLLAAYAAASLAGVCPADFQRAVESYDPHNGRLQHFVVDGRDVILNLAKNPTGLNQNVSLLLADDRPKTAFVVVNDNYNDGRDVSWIWDVDFERLDRVKDLRLIAGGHRANDVQVRLKYAGLQAAIAASVREALDQIADVDREQPLYVLANYSALWPAKAELEHMGESHE